MKKSSLSLLFALGLALAAGGAQAQFKAPTKSQPKDALGSGIGSSSIPPAGPAPASGAAASPGATEKTSAEEVVQKIADCILPGLPADWTMAQIDVREVARKDKERSFEAIYSYLDGEGKAGPFTPCDQKEPALNVYKLNGALEPSKRNWIRATLVFSKEGKFELQYDYAPKEGEKPAAAPTAAKKDAKKDTKKAAPRKE